MKPLYFAAAIVFLIVQSRGDFWFNFIFKALPIFMLMGMVLNQANSPFFWPLLLALGFSAAGDIALELDNKRFFVVGLAFFLIAHLWYAIAFWQTRNLSQPVWLAIIFITLFAIVLGRKLLPTLGKLKIPVLLYIGVIVLMGLAASVHSPRNLQLVLGAIIFMLSDATIAIHKFLHPVTGRDFIVMTTYYSAQFLMTTALLF